MTEQFEREFYITNSAVMSMRKYGPKYAKMDDEAIRDELDRRLVEIGLDKAEIYWERDPELGVQKNFVIKLGRLRNNSFMDSYAVVRDSENGPSVITIITQRAYEESLISRWMEDPPEVRRTRSSSVAINKPFEDISDKVEPVSSTPPELLLLFKRDNGINTILVGQDKPFPTVATAFDHLVGQGVDPYSITVWEKKDIKLKVKVAVEGI